MSRWRFTIGSAGALLAVVMLAGCGSGTNEPSDGKSVGHPHTKPNPQGKSRRPDIGYIPTPQVVVEKMLEMAQVKKTDLLYDLGCGDGRVVVTAAKKYGCRAIGIDIDPVRVKEATENAKKNEVEDLVQIDHDDLFTVDLSEADVVMVYLGSLNAKLIPQLKTLKPGSRIVSHDFDIPGLFFEQNQKIAYKDQETERIHDIYLWVVDDQGKDDPGS